MQHWLYYIVPRQRPRWFDPRIILWALLGNAEDGIFGEDSPVSSYQGVPSSLWQFVRWTLRNPFHNLTFHVLAWPGGPFWKWGKVPGWNGYIGWRPPQGRFGIAIRKETGLFVLAALLVLALASPADARPRHHHRHHVSHVSHAHSIYGPRPRAWCGYFMRQHTGIMDPSLNLARNWARVGSPASGPAPGVIGVMAHHVFEVVQVVAPGLVLAISGNDGNAVKTRVRSTSRVIAWRRV